MSNSVLASAGIVSPAAWGITARQYIRLCMTQADYADARAFARREHRRAREGRSVANQVSSPR